MSFESRLEASIPALRLRARRLANGHADQDDLVQETVIRALTSKSGFDGDNLMGWLYTIMKNHFLNEMRKTGLRRERRIQLTTSSAGVWTAQSPAAPDSMWSSRDIMAAVQQLPADFRDVVLHVGVEGLLYEEASEKLGCPVGTIMSRLHRARAACMRVMP